jgi:hypothetical protein
MDEMLRIAVDPGQNGGIAYSFLGKTYAVKMPPTDFDVVAFLAGLSKQSRLVELYLEEPSTGGWGPASKHSVGKLQFNVGVIYGASIALGFKTHRVRPAIWMKTHPVGTKGDRTSTEWKNILKQRAAELFPDHPVTLATCDALLILHAAARGEIK